jgi:hypothetical protein
LLDARARLLRAGVGFALVPPTEPELRLLHRWLDNWRGIGDAVRGMARQADAIEQAVRDALPIGYTGQMVVKVSIADSRVKVEVEPAE